MIIVVALKSYKSGARILDDPIEYRFCSGGAPHPIVKQDSVVRLGCVVTVINRLCFWIDSCMRITKYIARHMKFVHGV